MDGYTVDDSPETIRRNRLEFSMAPPEILDDIPVNFDTADLYEERCENEVPVDDEHDAGICNGRVVSTGGHGYYNGHYDCYTLYLECENCGPYEVECV